MVSGSFRCDPNRLRLLLEDQLPAEGQTELAEHIETCAACRRRLESLAADVKLWRQVGQLLRPEPEAELPTSAALRHDSSGAGTSPPAQATADRRPPLDFLAPSDDPQKLGCLGPYEIVEVIGSGGMGVVLKGFDAALNRFVAIKVLAPHLASSAAAPASPARPRPLRRWSTST
jgi:serine/threonine protein kinase